MQTPPQTESDAFNRAARTLETLRTFTGPAPAFWRLYLETLVALAGARGGLLLARRADNGSVTWHTLDATPPTLGAGGEGRQQFEALASAISQQEHLVNPLDGGVGQSGWVLGTRLPAEGPEAPLVLALVLPPGPPAAAQEALRRVRLVAPLPGAYFARRSAQETQETLSRFASVLDLMALLNAQDRFLTVAMTFCNEIAARHQCERVSLGWVHHDRVRLQALSHSEKFDKRMDAVRQVEETMEETVDQGALITFPAAESETLVTRAHAAFAESRGVKFLCSLPLREAGEPVAVVLCERNSGPFEDQELRVLALCVEMAERRLQELKKTDRWIGARLAASVRQHAARALGPEHTWTKVIAVTLAVGLLVLVVGRMNYRVEAPFNLRTDDMAIITAPFNGYVDRVGVEVGDTLKSNAVLLQLDQRDLLLEQAGAQADYDRFRRETEKARATNALAEMRIAEAQAQQAKARLDLTRYRLEQSVRTAPFDSVVIEGDWKKRVGSPVKEGDLLFRLARTDRTYVECEVREQDIHELKAGAAGEVAFASQPRLKFPVRILRIEPAAQVRNQQNVFLVRCQVEQGMAPWWRPGMSGLAKLNVGPRTFFWIITHRTLDFLRMYFWV